MLTFWILNESNIWTKVYHILINGAIAVNCCWNYGQPKLLLHFIEYCLDQLNNKHTKTAVNAAIQFFKSCNQKKYLVKVWIFLAHPPQYDGPVKFFVKLNGNHLLMANIFKFHKCQTFALLKMHNISKIWFGNKKFSLWKSLVYDKRAIENTIF